MERMNRRAIIKGASTSLSAMAVPVMANAATSNHPDAKLLQLAHELETNRTQQDTLWQLTLEKTQAAKLLYPPLPEVTRATAQDMNVFGFPPPTESFGKRVTHYGTFNRTELADLKCTTSTPTPLGEWLRSPAAKDRAMVFEGRVWTSKPCLKAEARKLEILKAIDTWKAECNSIDTQNGLHELDEQFQKQNDALEVALDQIEAIEAQTLAGLQAKVRAIVCLHEAGTIEFEDTADERIACQVLNGLVNNTVVAY